MGPRQALISPFTNMRSHYRAVKAELGRDIRLLRETNPQVSSTGMAHASFRGIVRLSAKDPCPARHPSASCAGHEGRSSRWD